MIKKHYYKIFLFIALAASLGYVVFSLFNSGNVIDSFESILSSLGLSIFTIIFVLTSLLLVDGKGGLLISVCAVILTGFIGFSFAADSNMIEIAEEESIVNLAGLTIAEATEWLNENEIEFTEEYVLSDEVPKYTIIAQDIIVGTLLKDIKSIKLTISDGPNYDKEVILPNMIGWSLDEVNEYIEKNYLIGIVFDFTVSDEPKNTVIDQDATGAMRRRDEVNIIFSIGTEEDLVPIGMIDLKDMLLFDATLFLKQNGIEYKLEYEFSNITKRNHIIATNKEIGDIVDPNSDVVTLIVSKGSEIVIPDFIQMTTDEITAFVVENKLDIEFGDSYDETVEIGKVIESNYEAGDIVEEGTLITIVVSKGQLKMESFSSLYSFREWATKYGVKYSESYEFSTSVASGSIISFSHAEGEVIGNTDTVYVSISKGKAITIPNYYNMSKSSIQTSCSSLGLKCSFASGNYSSTISKDYAYSQSRSSGSKVTSGTSMTITLSKGAPATTVVYIRPELYGSTADATISTLRTVLGNENPGVTFVFVKKPHNSLPSGYVHSDSPTTMGSSVTQGNTYTIWIVDN